MTRLKAWGGYTPTRSPGSTTGKTRVRPTKPRATKAEMAARITTNLGKTK